MFNKAIMIRTFHSVGHGCFVTERFNTIDGNEIKVVYDCGGIKKIIDKEINNTFVENDELYALCISHFDCDHINGLPSLLNRCQIVKNLWIPYLTDKEKIVLTFRFVSNLNSNFNFKDFNPCFLLINNPELLFNNREQTRITRIKPYNEDIDTSNLETIMNSGRNLFLNQINEKNKFNWEYIPFYHFDKSCNEAILNKINNNGFLEKYIIHLNKNIKLNSDLFLKDLKNKETGHSLIKELKHLFAKNGGSNENSMILYSGSQQKTRMSFKYNCECCSNLYCCNEVLLNSFNAGCMYFGDYNAKKNYINDRKFFEKYLNKCGIILLPHHGSLESFDNSLLFNNYKYAVSCHGKNDKYGHPSAQVCEKLYLNNKTIISVTEDSSSKAYFTVYDFI